MVRAVRTGVRLVAIVLALATAASSAAAEISNEKKVVAGLAVYLGVVPAALVRGNPSGHGERTMHGDASPGAGQVHVMVALFDAASGVRVTDARVEARVTGPGLGAQEKLLEPMLVIDALTYGNYFTMIGERRFEIALRISRPGQPRPVELRFEREHR